MPPANFLDPALEIALLWQPRATRGALAALFNLDARLQQVVAGAREPMLAQIRLAWWRERLGELGDRPTPGEPLLAELSASWGSAAPDLAPLVDGWEARLAGDDPTTFADGRAAALAAFALLAGAGQAAVAAGEVGRRWGLASAGEPLQATARIVLPRSLRGLAVLGGLATRAAARGEPMLANRGAAFAAWRLGLLGR